jgi:hypothetical protein
MRHFFLAATFAAILAAASSPAIAQTPEIRREPATPQQTGALHTLRQIPEACARLEGMFTGDAAQPYRFATVRTSANCQPRARFVDYAKAKPSVAGGWKFNDLIQVPNAGCQSQKAVVRVWRKPAEAVPPDLDAQGRSRLYLKDLQAAAKRGGVNEVPMYTAQMRVEGQACD